jgi:signal peptidase II
MTQERLGLVQRIAVVAAVVAGCVGCDQGTKAIARATLATADLGSLLGDTVRIQLALNDGAFLGLGGSLPEPWRSLLLSGGVGLVLLAVLAYALLARHASVWSVIAMALVFGGGVSNLADRILNAGHVVDFLNLGIGPLRTGIFNLADVALVAGVGMLWWDRKPPEEESPEPSSEA